MRKWNEKMRLVEAESSVQRGSQTSWFLGDGFSFINL